MRSLALVLAAALVGCSQDAGPTNPTFHRDCATPSTLRCSGLAIVTPREPIASSSVPVGPAYARGDGFDAFQGPALLQHYVIDGTPPRFHATTNAILSPSVGWSQSTSDGTNWFAFVNANPEHLRAWDASNAPLVDVSFGDRAGANQGGIAAFQGLALIHHADYGATDKLYMYDTNGALGWTVTGGIAASSPSAYGCGFALLGGAYQQPSLTTVPLDGRARMQQAGAAGNPTPWPYDPHAVAFASYDVPNYYTDPDASGPCDAKLVLAFDDGRPPITRTFARDCVSLLGGSWQAQVFSLSFGAVLSLGNGSFVLLDEQGNAVGAPVQIELQGDEATPHIAAGGDYIAAIVTEMTFTPNSLVDVETVIGCAP